MYYKDIQCHLEIQRWICCTIAIRIRRDAHRSSREKYWALIYRSRRSLAKLHSRGQGRFRDDHERMEYMNILHIYDYTYVSAYTRWFDNFDHLTFIFSVDKMIKFRILKLKFLLFLLFFFGLKKIILQNT